MKLVADSVAKAKKAKKQCLVFGCTATHAKRGSLCSHHEHESKKEKNPLQYWYGVLRRNAKRRHKVFTITLDDFKEFCDKTGYLTLKGRNVGNMSIDRVIDDLGYIPGNIQILEHGANVRKKYTDYWMRQASSYAEPSILNDEDDWAKPKQPYADEEAPF